MENLVNFHRLENNFKEKRVFLSGHTGFKGDWMLKTFPLVGAEIKGYTLEPLTLFITFDGG